MKLVIGGAYQGKREAACRMFGCAMEEIADGAVCALAAPENEPVLGNFHLYVRRWMEAQPDGESLEQPAADSPSQALVDRQAQALADYLIRVNPQIILISDEIGYGIVPMDAEERAWRELTGRVCCLLAAYADTVVRVVAGMPVILKQVKP